MTTHFIVGKNSMKEKKKHSLMMVTLISTNVQKTLTKPLSWYHNHHCASLNIYYLSQITLLQYTILTLFIYPYKNINNTNIFFVCERERERELSIGFLIYHDNQASPSFMLNFPNKGLLNDDWGYLHPTITLGEFFFSFLISFQF